MLNEYNNKHNKHANRRGDEIFSESASEDDDYQLKESELIAINPHMRNRGTNRSSKMSNDMQQIYKDALMNVIFGNFKEATEKLKNLITIYPNNPDPYHLLGTMHEQLNENDKAVEYFLISTYWSPPNLEKWIKVAEMSFDLQMYEQAAYCYGRALKIEKYNLELMSQRAICFERIDQSKKAIVIYKKMLKINSSVSILKKYARLRFRRSQYSVCRDILKTASDWYKDLNLVNMIGQTYLKEANYEELLNCIVKFFQETLTPINLQLPFEILKMLYIVSACLPEHYNSTDLTMLSEQCLCKYLYSSYQQELWQSYEELIVHLRKLHPQKTYNLLKFLVEHGKKHHSIENYMLLSQYCKQHKKYISAIQFISDAILQYPKSSQLQVELNYLKVLKCSKNVKKNKKNTNKFKIQQQKVHDDEDIFYSDREEEQEEHPKQTSSKINTTVTEEHTTNIVNVNNENFEVMNTVLNSAKQTIASILHEKMENYFQYYMEVHSSLQMLVNMAPYDGNKLQHKGIRKGIYHSNVRKRRYYDSDHTTKMAIIHQNEHIIVLIIEYALQYMLKLFKNISIQQQTSIASKINTYNENRSLKYIKQLCQLLSKVYFLRWRCSKQIFRSLKVRIYDLGLLVCIKLGNFNNAIFFIRFLILRYPDNSTYLRSLNFLLRNCGNRSSINSVLGKLMSKNLQSTSNDPKLRNIQYISAVHYMGNGFYDLAINCFLRIISTTHKLAEVYLCMSCCFLQIASSRNTHNKIDMVNYSAYYLHKYADNATKSPYVIYNIGRWYAQVGLNQEAIYYFKKVLEDATANEQLHHKVAYCMMCIYRQMQQYSQLNKLSHDQFSL